VFHSSGNETNNSEDLVGHIEATLGPSGGQSSNDNHIRTVHEEQVEQAMRENLRKAVAVAIRVKAAEEV
jgi:hypothetical protein